MDDIRLLTKPTLKNIFLISVLYFFIIIFLVLVWFQVRIPQDLDNTSQLTADLGQRVYRGERDTAGDLLSQYRADSK